jgi:C4-type Zn-finger protein
LSPLYLEERLEEYRVLLEQAEQDGLHARSVAPKKVGEIPDITLELVPALQVQVEQLEGILARLERHANPNMISADDKQTEAEEFIRQTVFIHSNAQAKYLVEVWEGGTICDMTSKARKIEIEFHCGADGADEIVGVKEIAT